jgi:hypothetical protein
VLTCTAEELPNLVESVAISTLLTGQHIKLEVRKITLVVQPNLEAFIKDHCPLALFAIGSDGQETTVET